MKKKIMAEIVATNFVASRPPVRRPTGTPHARAKIMMFIVATNIAMLPVDRLNTDQLECRMLVPIVLTLEHFD